ncbi:DUF2800 domain-containing protein [Rhodoligotrophos defluvii]|uniref:DUF2800 domain-containing protein n=1 Tax=Rhodoligotrophos defluvii TaxID=2561934 RepID=UPI0010C9CA76|nr:DUF2800 domain-containing protein [Rhodoligotrophos defluvii]
MNAPHTTRAHARLSPSAAYRWLVCPGSIRLSDGIPDKSSVYANEGTAAHMLAEHCLRHGWDADRYLDCVIDITAEGNAMFGDAGTENGDNRWLVDEEMVHSVQIYLDHCRSIIAPADELEIECKLDLTHVIPDGFGTGDTLVYQVEQKHLHVVDLKYGVGVPVDPQNNPQLLTYAVGALKRYHNREVEKVTLTVVQPRAPHRDGEVRSWETDPATVVEFEDVLRRGAQDTARDDAPLVPGDHCKFCKAAAVCPALRDKALEIARAEFIPDEQGYPVVPSPVQLDRDELAHILSEAEILEGWVKRVKEFAHQQALAGNLPTGFKLVQKRATRKWQDEAAVVSLLELTFELAPEDIYEEPKVKSPARIEKLVGKKSMALLRGAISQESSGLSLVPDSDPRPAAKPDAATEFAA